MSVFTEIFFIGLVSSLHSQRQLNKMHNDFFTFRCHLPSLNCLSSFWSLSLLQKMNHLLYPAETQPLPLQYNIPTLPFLLQTSLLLLHQDTPTLSLFLLLTPHHQLHCPNSKTPNLHCHPRPPTHLNARKLETFFLASVSL